MSSEGNITVIESFSADDTHALGVTLGQQAKPGDVCTLVGDLGVGKTVLTQGMFSNFFSNLGNGKVSGLGIGALIASAYMIFGRTGLLGKIGGALMAMMMIGNNSSKQAQVKEENLEKQETQEKQNSIHR